MAAVRRIAGAAPVTGRAPISQLAADSQFPIPNSQFPIPDSHNGTSLVHASRSAQPG